MACISLYFCSFSIAMEKDSAENTSKEEAHEFEATIMPCMGFCLCNILSTIESESNIELNNGGKTDIWTLLNTDFRVKAVQRHNPLAIVELIQKCRNANSQFNKTSPRILRKYQLIDENHRPHEHIKDIMISMATGDGDDMVIGNPAAPLIKVK